MTHGWKDRLWNELYLCLSGMRVPLVLWCWEKHPSCLSVTVSSATAEIHVVRISSHYAVQGHSKSLILVLIKSPYLNVKNLLTFLTLTLQLVVSLLLLRDFGTLFPVELLHPLTHLRHFSLIRHNHIVARASVLWRNINWLIDWLH